MIADVFTDLVEMPVLLLVDRATSRPDPFVRGMASEGFHVLLAQTGEEGMEIAAKARPAAVLVGSDIGDLSAHALVRLLRSAGVAPVIAVSGTDDEDEVVLALEMGAADFLTRPSRVRENAARIWAAIRAVNDPSVPSLRDRVPLHVLPAPRTIAAGPVELDAVGRTLRVRGHSVHVRPKEMALLQLLIVNAGKVVTREQSLETIWPNCRAEGEKTLDVHVRRLRLMIEDDVAHPRHLITLRGQGHRFDT